MLRAVDAIPAPHTRLPNHCRTLWRQTGFSVQAHTINTQEILLDVAEKLPPEVRLVDAICALVFRQAVEEGLASLDRGERVSVEEARRRIPQWIPKACGVRLSTHTPRA